MLDVLLVTMSLIAVIAMFFLCYITYTLNKELKHNDDVINQLQNERDNLECMHVR
jgi:cbb3-type cytochrome oxidase subunit 3